MITKYFPVAAQELQRIATYDPRENVYPFSYYSIDDERFIAPYAEVVHSSTNKDGSITMVVDVPNLYNDDDCEIRHVLTIKPAQGGSFQYLSNVVKINNFKEEWFAYYLTRVSKNVLKP